MSRMLAAIGAKLGVEFEGDPSLDALLQATRPQALARQIDSAGTKP